jgi:tetratricopeptide (TPR) repeat protein
MNMLIDIKIKELNINHYSNYDGQLERLQSFIDEFSTDIGFERYHRDLIYLKADALANAQRHEEAIELFDKLYRDETYIFPTMMAQRIAEQLLLLKRENEALALINEALKNESKLIDRLYLLYSALSNLDDPDTKLQEYNDQIGEISEHLGIDIPEKHETFSAKITYLRNENNKASRRYHEILIKNRDLPKSGQIAALKHYTEKAVVKKYQLLAEEAISILNSTLKPVS